MENSFDCYRCGTTMEKISEGLAEYDENVTVIVYKCPECGATHTLTTVDPDSKNDYPFYNEEAENGIPNVSHGYPGQCLLCGTNIVWQSDFMRSEVWGDVGLTEEGQKMHDELVAEIAKVDEAITNSTNSEEFDRLQGDKQGLETRLNMVDYDYINNDDDSLATYCTCPHCGSMIEIVDAKPSEKNANS